MLHKQMKRERERKDGKSAVSISFRFPSLFLPPSLFLSHSLSLELFPACTRKSKLVSIIQAKVNAKIPSGIFYHSSAPFSLSFMKRLKQACEQLLLVSLFSLSLSLPLTFLFEKKKEKCWLNQCLNKKKISASKEG